MNAYFVDVSVSCLFVCLYVCFFGLFGGVCVSCLGGGVVVSGDVVRHAALVM